jgi:hypothetical protein
MEWSARMADDLLAQFRRTGATSVGGAKLPSVPKEYVAFAAKDRSQYLDIRLARPPYHSPRNNLLVNVAHDGPFGTNFLVTYTTMSVLVKGCNLQELVFAIQNQMAAYIQEFDPHKWPKLKNEKAPFIESIEIHFHGDITGANNADAVRH